MGEVRAAVVRVSGTNDPRAHYETLVPYTPEYVTDSMCCSPQKDSNAYILRRKYLNVLILYSSLKKLMKIIRVSARAT